MDSVSIFHSEIESTLKNGSRKKRGESSQSSTEISHSYTVDSRRFVGDTSTSLHGHENKFKQNTEKMVSAFEKFGDGWKEHLNTLNACADMLSEESGKLRILLDDYARNI